MSEVLEATKATTYFAVERISGEVNQSPEDTLPMSGPPIELFTENGFCLVRISELQSSIADSVNGCYFLVRDPQGQESDVVVDFDERLIAQVQRQRHYPLSDASRFWPTLAEQHLASYLWQNNRFPAEGALVICHLIGPELSLAAGWID